MAEPLLRVTDLVKHYPLSRGLLGRERQMVRAVDGVSLTLDQGETLGIVGESGCGKTTLSRSIFRLIQPTGGRVEFRGVDLLALGPEELRRMRRHMQIVFQDPFGSLNPRMTVRELIEEPLLVHTSGGAQSRRARIEEILDLVGLGRHHLERFPHEFSGGQRQRIGIARALILNPELVIGDEPVSALDVSIRAQILNLLARLQERLNLSYIIVSHDLGVVRYICHRVAVMYLGRIVEQGPTEGVFRDPLHPYTQALVAAVPVPRVRSGRRRVVLTGEVPSPVEPPSGCHFHPRCPRRTDVCTRVAPEPRRMTDGRMVACHLFDGDPRTASSGPKETGRDTDNKETSVNNGVLS